MMVVSWSQVPRVLRPFSWKIEDAIPRKADILLWSGLAQSDFYSISATA